MADWHLAIPFAALFLLAVSYTATELVQILAAIGVLIGILGGIIVNIISTWRIEKKADAREVVLTDVAKKAATIEGHVNSEQTALKATITSLEKENGLLRGVAQDNKEIAARLAQAAERVMVHTVSIPVPNGSVVAAVTPAAPAPQEPHLQAIEKNTADTAANTAKTDATVTALKEST